STYAGYGCPDYGYSYAVEGLNAQDACCDCGGGSLPEGLSDNDIYLSQNPKYDYKSINIYDFKASRYDRTQLVDSPNVIDITTGEITPGDNNGSRLVTYLVNVSCDSCLGGGAYSGSFESASTSITITGFDDQSTACATVLAINNAGEYSPESGSACAVAGGCTDVDEDGICDDVDECIGEELACGCNDPGFTCDDGSVVCDESDCSSCAAGDLNDDTLVNVLDVVAMVSIVLSPDSEYNECADINGDGAINVLDVVATVSIVLGGSDARSADATSATMNREGGTLNISGNGYIGAVQMTLTHGADFSIELTDDAFVAEYKTEGNTTRLMVVVPNSEEIFTASGEYDVEEVIVANSNTLLSVVEPSSFELGAAYPNPFNPSTSLSINMPENGYVSVKAYNLVGQVVSVITEGNMDAGSHTMTWDASSLSSGVYLITAEYAGSVATQKVMLIK
ncbi:MAG: hypothetical protein CMG13_06340, partial [Candidatus Marinimicrobia bacterium]|nr:hypothetical protein [Candidatus Neomarinimicrobiota bacterium]